MPIHLIQAGFLSDTWGPPQFFLNYPTLKITGYDDIKFCLSKNDDDSSYFYVFHDINNTHNKDDTLSQLAPEDARLLEAYFGKDTEVYHLWISFRNSKNFYRIIDDFIQEELNKRKIGSVREILIWDTFNGPTIPVGNGKFVSYNPFKNLDT